MSGTTIEHRYAEQAKPMEQGPAVPRFVLRGHEAPIHALQFYFKNTFLASGDSDGWMVVWSLASKRPIAVWRGHEGAVMAIRNWTDDRLVTHGRDHKLRVWEIRPKDVGGLSTKLPADGALPDQPQPWLLHSLSVNALNFCAFALCDETSQPQQATEKPIPQLIASPNGLDTGGIDIFQLPSERRVSQIHSDQDTATGSMVMAVALVPSTESSLVLITGYEDGRVMVHSHQTGGDLGTTTTSSWTWQTILTSKPHSQPVLSLGLTPLKEHFITSGADATLAKFPLPLLAHGTSTVTETAPTKAVNTKHAGQQSLSVRSDGKIFATAGWDGRIRVYSTKTMKELAVLKWHALGCYATAIADVGPGASGGGSVSRPRTAEASTSNSTDLAAASLSALDVIKQQREEKARSTHWIAGGGKDGKISLWDIY